MPPRLSPNVPAASPRDHEGWASPPRSASRTLRSAPRTRAGLLAAGLALAFHGCADPAAGPPGHRPLDEASRLRLERWSLRDAPSPGHPLEVSLGRGAVTLLGVDVEPVPLRAPGRARLRWYWRAERRLEEDLRVFVHGEMAGQRVANGDHALLQGLLASSRWTPGTVYVDEHELELPPLPAGELQLWVGLHRVDRRLAPDEPAATDGAGRIRGPRLAVHDARPPPPRVPVRRAASAPTLDGRLDEPIWAETAPLRLVRSLDGAAAALVTDVRLAWDPAHLYVAFEVEDPDVWGTLSAHDAPLHTEEVVELLIARGDGPGYRELELAPTGAILDAAFAGPRQGRDLGFTARVRRGVHVAGSLNDPSDRDRGYTIELALPAAALGAEFDPLRAGEALRGNVFRLDAGADRRTWEGQAWSPPFAPDFHVVDRFGAFELAP